MPDERPVDQLTPVHSRRTFLRSLAAGGLATSAPVLSGCPKDPESYAQYIEGIRLVMEFVTVFANIAIGVVGAIVQAGTGIAIRVEINVIINITFNVYLVRGDEPEADVMTALPKAVAMSTMTATLRNGELHEVVCHAPDGEFVASEAGAYEVIAEFWDDESQTVEHHRTGIFDVFEA